MTQFPAQLNEAITKEPYCEWVIFSQVFEQAHAESVIKWKGNIFLKTHSAFYPGKEETNIKIRKRKWFIKTFLRIKWV